MRMIIKKLIETDNIPRNNIFYINKDISAFDFISNAKILNKIIAEYHKVLKPKGKVYIFIDEIQEILNWEKIVNSLSQDYTKEYELFITGSNSKLLSGELSTYLSGRYITINIYPFSFSEYLGFYNIEPDKKTYINYLQMGGIPELYNLPDKELRTNYISALKDSIILRDIIQRYNIRDVILLRRLIDFVIDSQSSLFSVNKIVNTFISMGIKTNQETISAYLGYLSNVYFLHESTRYDLKGKRILKGERKYYLNDLSFKYYLTSSFDRGIGKLLENSIYLHYKREGYQIYTGIFNNKEIDFVIEKNGDKKYIQVAYTLTDEAVIEREFGNLKKIKDNYEKLVITLDDISIGNIEGIQNILAWEL
ncbi:MAG: ATP-binding protein [Spirochaetes bacterium]|nr:MAG: ATP-binding protein [Spirochaetota bacterium]